VKGIPGIIVAVGLGLIGALCNWFYLDRLAGKEAKEQFIGIKAGVQLNSGDPIKEEHLISVGIPRSNLGNLDQVAPRWSVRGAVIGLVTARTFRGGEIVLHDDLATPGQRDLSEKLGPDEVAMWLPVDPRSFSSARVNPDDEVMFIAPRTGTDSPTPIAESTPVGVPSGSGTSEVIGPFRILEIGTRTGRPEIQKAAGLRSGNESSITVTAKLLNGRLEPKAERLTDIIRQTRSQGLQVLLLPKKKK